MVELPADTIAVHSEDRELIARPALPAYALQELFHSKIPITRAMGVKVESYDGECLILSAPLAENINHLGTAFGGSLNALAVLAGYGLLWLELSEMECHVVIRRSSISYDRPVRSVLVRATCSSPGKEILSEFKRSFQQKGGKRASRFPHTSKIALGRWPSDSKAHMSHCARGEGNFNLGANSPHGSRLFLSL